MQTVIPGLYASAPEPLPFGRSLHDRAFLLAREHGNLLVYSSGTVAADARAIEDLGGISRQYLNHWHEAAFGIDQVAKTFEAELVCHENERPSVSAKGKVERDLLPAPPARRRLRGDPNAGPHQRSDGLPLGQRPASLPVHRRQHLPAGGRVGRSGARRLQRSRRLHPEPRADPRPRIRCADCRGSPPPVNRSMRSPTRRMRGTASTRSSRACGAVTITDRPGRTRLRVLCCPAAHD